MLSIGSLAAVLSVHVWVCLTLSKESLTDCVWVCVCTVWIWLQLQCESLIQYWADCSTSIVWQHGFMHTDWEAKEWKHTNEPNVCFVSVFTFHYLTCSLISFTLHLLPLFCLLHLNSWLSKEGICATSKHGNTKLVCSGRRICWSKSRKMLSLNAPQWCIVMSIISAFLFSSSTSQLFQACN